MFPCRRRPCGGPRRIAWSSAERHRGAPRDGGAPVQRQPVKLTNRQSLDGTKSAWLKAGCARVSGKECAAAAYRKRNAPCQGRNRERQRYRSQGEQAHHQNFEVSLWPICRARWASSRRSDQKIDGHGHDGDHQPGARCRHGDLIASEFDHGGKRRLRCRQRARSRHQVEGGDGSVRPATGGDHHGPVDHGKTSLLDAIRSTNGPPRARRHHPTHRRLSCRGDGRSVTFLDTPATRLNAMRARGAKVTDIVVP